MAWLNCWLLLHSKAIWPQLNRTVIKSAINVIRAPDVINKFFLSLSLFDWQTKTDFLQQIFVPILTSTFEFLNKKNANSRQVQFFKINSVITSSVCRVVITSLFNSLIVTCPSTSALESLGRLEKYPACFGLGRQDLSQRFNMAD